MVKGWVKKRLVTTKCNKLIAACCAKNVMGCRAPLFPKLRGQFAEFLQHSYLYHLGLLDLSTSVGLGTVDALDCSLFNQLIIDFNQFTTNF